ncbi:MAG: DUF4340 domain-containing protein [Pirellulaceae bacterium]
MSTNADLQNKEGLTTLTFAGVAAVACLLAWWFSPGAISSEKDLKGDITGKPIFAKFEDPAAASTFEIIKFDEELAQLEPFEVARDSKTQLWRLPSYDDYPADAAEQVSDAVTPLTSMPVIDIVSFDRGDHELYGVVNPDDEDLSVTGTGVGMLVRVKDDKDTILASLIIGKEVDGVEGQRYVRVPTEDAVYTVEIDTTPFTTDFKKWIKDKLLDVTGFQITGIGLRDYLLTRTQGAVAMTRNFDADLTFEAGSSKWTLDRLVTYQGAVQTEEQLSEDEKLNDTKLNELRNSIQDLEIVGVYRKPKGLAADLKADQALMNNNESLQSLYARGFYPQEGEAGMEMFATGGETLVSTKDGVKYLLRFGESDARLGNESEDAGDDPNNPESEDSAGLRRYLLVSAALDQTQFPQPDLQIAPQTVEEMLAAEKAKEAPATTEPNAADQPAEGTDPPAVETPTVEPSAAETPAEPASETTVEEPPKPSEPTPAEAAATDEPQPAAKVEEDKPAAESSNEEPAEASPEQPTSDDQNLDACEPQENPQEESPSAQARAEPDAAAKPSDEPSTSAPADEATEAQEKSAEVAENAATDAGKAEADDSAPAKVETAEELQERLELLQEQIARENQRLLDERKEKMDEARKKVQELNARFADWYYVVSDSVYKKLTLTRDELVESKTAAAPDGTGLPGAPTGLPPNVQFPGQP